MPKPQYGTEHRKARDRALAMMPNGAPCPRCNRPMYKWQRLQLGHAVSVAMGGSNGPTRMEHGSCNESAGARLGNRLKRIRRKRGKGMPSLAERLSNGVPSLAERLSNGVPSNGVPMPSVHKSSKPGVYRDSKPIASSNDKSMDGIGDKGIAGNRTAGNKRLPRW
jgi:hypothetical protein